MGCPDVSSLAGSAIVTVRLLFVVNSPAFFISHRLPIALAAKKEGYEVHVGTMPGEAVSQIIEAGLFHHELPLTRSGRNFLNELFVFSAIYKLFCQLKPGIVHLVTIKPVIYGGLAARLAGVPSVVAAISGLGYVFIARGFKASLVRAAVMSLYRLAFRKRNLCVIFQNNDDRSRFVKADTVRNEKTVLIRGSGVDLEDYTATVETAATPIIIMISRLLRDKGVGEFVEATRMIIQRGIKARFLMVGDADPHNPATVTKIELDLIRKEGRVELLGHRSDIPELLAISSIVVLPSYREGLPKVLVEAAAAGRAVVTTDVPGCRDAIEPDISGLLVPVRDANALANAIQRLIEDVELRQKMGRAGRQLAEKEFSIEKIVQAHLDIYRMLEANA
jgi:glycosyltransferase involved in cell wall biosynthesis